MCEGGLAHTRKEIGWENTWQRSVLTEMGRMAFELFTALGCPMCIQTDDSV